MVGVALLRWGLLYYIKILLLTFLYNINVFSFFKCQCYQLCKHMILSQYYFFITCFTSCSYNH